MFMSLHGFPHGFLSFCTVLCGAAHNQLNVDIVVREAIVRFVIIVDLLMLVGRSFGVFRLFVWDVLARVDHRHSKFALNGHSCISLTCSL